MTRAWIAAVTVLLLPVSCGTSPRGGPPPEADAGRRLDDPLSGVMQAKLWHARAILAGLALADYAKIEKHARQLHDLSEDAEWMVTDSVTYVVSSDTFRRITLEMADHARAEDLNAAAADFALMTETCVACHTYLRRERLERDFPGKISQAGSGGDPLAALPPGPHAR